MGLRTLQLKHPVWGILQSSSLDEYPGWSCLCVRRVSGHLPSSIHVLVFFKFQGRHGWPGMHLLALHHHLYHFQIWLVFLESQTCLNWNRFVEVVWSNPAFRGCLCRWGLFRDLIWSNLSICVDRFPHVPELLLGLWSPSWWNFFATM